MTWRPNIDVTQTEGFLGEGFTAWKEEKRFPRTIVLKEKSELVGMIEFRSAGFKAEIGYVLARPYWGHGIMTKAAKCVVDWARARRKSIAFGPCAMSRTWRRRVCSKKLGWSVKGF